MDYNTQLNKLALPEYGRHIQRMVEHLRTIPDRDKRNEQAKAVIAVMGNLFPYLRDINDFKHKLWDHLFIIADFDLDIDSPYPKPNPTTFEEKPREVPYTSPDSIKIKHYGRGIQDMVMHVAEMPDDEKRRTATMALANHMKKAYLSWNKDVVSDDIIYKDIETLSGGKIKLNADDVRLRVGNYSVSSNNGGTGNGHGNGHGHGHAGARRNPADSNRQRYQPQQRHRQQQAQAAK
jgi:hypothetical protein